MNLLEGNNVCVGWRWQWDVSDYDTKKLEDHDTGSELETETQHEDFSEESEGDTEQESARDDDMFSSSLVTHTVMFNCIGVKKENAYQDALIEANGLLLSGEDVPVRLTPEPNNPYDSEAIAFECHLKDKKWRRIGYVVREALQETHKALNNGDILSVRFGWIKFISDWYMSGPGFFAGIKVSKRGEWPASIVRCSSTRFY